MTQQHILYIPIVFLLGFIIGLLFAQVRSSKAKSMEISHHTRARNRLVYVFIVFAMIFTITHVFDLPYNSKNVKSLLGHEIFDKSPVFSANEVYQKISGFSLDGIKAYKIFIYTSDLLFPMAFLLFLLAYHRYMLYKSGPALSKCVLMRSLPYMWFLSDLLENLLVFSVLNLYPTRYDVLAGSIGFVTVTKFTLLVSSLMLPIVFFAYSKLRASKIGNPVL